MLTEKSPEKENRSPERLRRNKANKQLKTFQQLMQIIKTYGIPLPSHLAHEGLNNYQADYSKENEEAKALKVKLADYEFEIKKVEEDFAEFKLLAKIEKDKCTKKLRQQLEWERSKNIEQNRRWEKDCKQKYEQHFQQIQHLRSQLEICNQALKSLNELNKKNQKHILHLYQSHKQREDSYQQNILSLRNQFQLQMDDIKKQHIKEIDNMERIYQQNLKQQQKVCEVKVLAVQSEKNIEVKATEQAKQQIIKDQDKLTQQIQTIQRAKLKLEEQVNSLKIKNKVLNKKWEDRGHQIQRLRKDHERQLQQIVKEREVERLSLSALIEQQKLVIMKQSYSQMEQLQSKFSELQDTKKQIEQTYRDLLSSVQLRFNQRQSKREDIEIIKQFQQQLQEHKREKTQMYHQLRLMQLQNQNNEKLYTRIFTNKREKKSISQRIQRDWLVRQCQTTDLRTILKINRK